MGKLSVFPFAALVPRFSSTQQTEAGHHVDYRKRPLISLVSGMTRSKASLKITMVE